MSNYSEALLVVKRLQDKGFIALFAGGCVRDQLLGRQASDYDVATDAKPEQIQKLFRRTLAIGAQFGVIIVLLGGKQVEVATFRTDADYSDGRHPSAVVFSDPQHDALRRDFTINGMFFDPIAGQLYDYVGGQEDLAKRQIRTIGHPAERFSEDYLRMLRAVRFAVKLEFSIEPATWRAICENAHQIIRISPERICAELEQILTLPARQQGATLLWQSGLTTAIFPQMSADDAALGAAVLGQLPQEVDFALALAAFWAGLAATTVEPMCKALRLPVKQTRHVLFLLEKRGVLADPQLPLSQLKMLMAHPCFVSLVDFQRALQMATGAPTEPVERNVERAAALDPATVKPAPLLNGYDLMALGAQGPQIGQLAKELYIAQLEEHLTTPQQARQWAQAWLDAHRRQQRQ